MTFGLEGDWTNCTNTTTHPHLQDTQDCLNTIYRHLSVHRTQTIREPSSPNYPTRKRHKDEISERMQVSSEQCIRAVHDGSQCSFRATKTSYILNVLLSNKVSTVSLVKIFHIEVLL